MELTDLAAFEAVAEAGAMGRAAETLDTVQSNVTTRIRKLERVAGFEDRWQLEWIEEDVATQGGGAAVTTWSATVRTAHVEPENQDQFYANPTGVYVVDVAWTPVTQPRAVQLQDAQELARAARQQRLRDTYRELRTDSVANDPR